METNTSEKKWQEIIKYLEKINNESKSESIIRKLYHVYGYGMDFETFKNKMIKNIENFQYLG